MMTVTTVSDLRSALAKIRQAGKTLGLVPTMGNLHAGHLSLVDAAKRECQAVAASIFVNPTQFAPHEDFNRYPRTLEADLEQLQAHGCDLVFAPTPAEMYPQGFATHVEVGGVAEPLEGAKRPGHFRGVATVVLKLFQQFQPDVAFFGQKDYQQLQVIRQMASDLNLPLSIRGCPIVRDPDGLAMSSRNQYLTPAQRQQALALSRGLAAAQKAVKLGERDAAQVAQSIRAEFDAAGVTEIDYIAIVDPETLLPVEQLTSPTLAALAARVGTTRLIDNRLLL